MPLFGEVINVQILYIFSYIKNNMNLRLNFRNVRYLNNLYIFIIYLNINIYLILKYK